MDLALGDRYVIVRQIGEGGMGVVYEAIDRREQRRVALKTMRSIDPSALYRFKNEFRALADVTHPNLVTLYDFVADDPDAAFFTMELVDGMDFLRHARFGAEAAVADTLLPGDPGHRAPAAGPGASSASAILSAQPTSPRPTVGCDLERVRAALVQLARGVEALHRRGKLHRDLKPSNVLVTPTGRAVVLDFGLVADLSAHAADPMLTAQQLAAGTPEYMSPEQGAGGELAEPSDWYAVGVMLYEALVGRLPFSGSRVRVLMDKQERLPPAPGELVAGVPPDLAALCMELLHPNPARRPRGVDVLRRLGEDVGAPEASKGQSGPTQGSQAAPFIGRSAHLAALGAAFRRVEEGHAVTMFVHGASGMGKSLLLRRFVESIVHRGDVLVFSGRCYERESMPYKALDSIIDALSRHLRRLPNDEVEALLPREVLLLARLFPVLVRVEAIAGAPKRTFEIPDPHELRRRAFSALRALVHRIAQRQPTVLWIDDLQWGDPDSAGLLAELTRAPEAPPILLIGSYRSEDSASPLIAALLDARTRAPGMDVRSLEVGPLARADAETLAFELLADHRDPAAARQQAEAIAEESDGSPFFIDELVRHVESDVATDASTAPAPSEVAPGQTGRSINLRLDEVLLRRVAALSADARHLLEIIAVAGRPVARPVAAQAAELSPDREATSLGVLRAGHLVRSLRTLDRYDVDTFHDRVREAVLSSLGPTELAARHRRIALALATTAGADPEALATHFRAAGDREPAAEHAVAAAAKAIEALAFDRAAAFYAMALDVRPSTLGPNALGELRWKYGDALANAGRGPEAARAYLQAASEAGAGDALELRRRAAEQLLRSGRFEEGLEVVGLVLGAVGMALPSTPRRALLSAAWSSVRVRLRGFSFRPRSVAQIAPEALTRIDVCWSINHTLGLVDPICSTSFQKRQTLLALDAGDPYRVARALSMEMVSSSLGGRSNARRTAAIGAIAQEAARTSGKAHAIALFALCRAMAAFLEGRERAAVADCKDAIETFRDSCTGVSWEIGTASLISLWSLWRLGELRELALRVPVLIQDARDRGDLYQDSMLRLGMTNTAFLVADEPERAVEEVTEASAWANADNTMHRYYGALARVNLELYRGRPEAAAASVEGLWSALRSSMVLTVENIGLEAVAMRARAAVGVASTAADPGPSLAIAARGAKQLERSSLPWARAHGGLVRASVDVARGHTEAAVRALDRVVAAASESGCGLFLAVAQRRKAELVGGDEGRALLSAADAFMTAQTIRAPERMTEMLAPGFVRGGRARLLGAAR